MLMQMREAGRRIVLRFPSKNSGQELCGKPVITSRQKQVLPDGPDKTFKLVRELWRRCANV
jgi:hypothetical protein